MRCILTLRLVQRATNLVYSEFVIGKVVSAFYCTLSQSAPAQIRGVAGAPETGA